MSGAVVVGTVRARRGETHTIVLSDGSRRDVVLQGDDVPMVGGDVIGNVDEDGPAPRMTLVKDIAKVLLQGRALVSVSGRPEVTARMLSRLLAGAGPALVRPGVGGIIERTPHVHDPDLAWALSALEPEARRLGIALNVIDPIALAGAEWSEGGLKDSLLPADATGDGRGLRDLRRLMRGGFTPSCLRAIEGASKASHVSSVDFVMPYSPFATGHSFSCDAGRAFRSEVARHPIPNSDARRLSCFREISLAFAQRYLGHVRGGPDIAGHAEQCFADAAAVIAFVKSGGDASSALRLSRLRQAALSRWDGAGAAPPATHRTLDGVLSNLHLISTTSLDDVLRSAAAAALSGAPRTPKALQAMAADAEVGDAFVDLESCGSGTMRAVRRSFERDMGETLARIADSPSAVERFGRFGLYTAPAGLEDAFDSAVESHGSLGDRDLEMADAEALADEADALSPSP